MRSYANGPRRIDRLPPTEMRKHRPWPRVVAKNAFNVSMQNNHLDSPQAMVFQPEPQPTAFAPMTASVAPDLKLR